MRKRRFKTHNFIILLSFILCIFIISRIIQADMPENIIDIKNEVELLPPSEKEGEALEGSINNTDEALGSSVTEDKNTDISIVESENGKEQNSKPQSGESMVKIDDDKTVIGESVEADILKEDKEKLASSSDANMTGKSIADEALDDEGLFSFDTFADDIDYVHVSPNMYWVGNGLDTVYVGIGQEERNAARATLRTDKYIDYVHHTITWAMTISNQGSGWWSSFPAKWRPLNTEVYLYIPKHEGNVTVVRNHSRLGSKTMGFSGIGTNRLVNSGGGTVMDKHNPPFSKWYEYFRNAAGNAGTNADIKKRGGIPDITSNINWFTDTGVISQIYQDNDTGGIGPGESITYTFTTRHSIDENLDDAVGGISIRHFNNSNERYMLRGKFGVARRHKLRTPDFRYVKDDNNLTEAEKEKVRKDVVDKTIEYYRENTPKFVDVEIEELRDAYNNGNIGVSNSGEVLVTWDDGTESRLFNVADYIGVDRNPPIINAVPENVSVSSKDEPIEVSVSAKDEEGFLSEIDTVDLPEGLRVAEKQINNKTGSMKIVGNLTNLNLGEEIKINIRAKDSWGNISEKEVIIDTSMVPVGTNESGYKLPLLISIISLLGFSCSFISLGLEENY